MSVVSKIDLLPERAEGTKQMKNEVLGDDEATILSSSFKIIN